MKFSQKKAVILPAVILVASLSACGGGGGGGNTGGNNGNNGSTPTTVSPEALVTSVPSASYSADNAAIFSQVNAVRGPSNSGLLAQNTNLDQAASGHANFLVNNNLVSNFAWLTTNFSGTLGGHYEAASYNNASLTGYVGATPSDRAATDGYKGNVTEEVSFGAASGAACIGSLLNSVYHLVDLMQSVEQVGISFNPGNGSGSACVIELGTPSTSGGQFPATSATTVYPANGQTGVPITYLTASELPQVPVASSYPQMGQPIVVSLYSLANSALTANKLSVQSFSLHQGSASGTAVAATVLAAAGVTSAANLTLTTDVNLAQPGMVVLVPNAPLAASTTYYVQISATVNGSSVTNAWSFTTGA